MLRNASVKNSCYFANQQMTQLKSFFITWSRRKNRNNYIDSCAEKSNSIEYYAQKNEGPMMDACTRDPTDEVTALSLPQIIANTGK